MGKWIGHNINQIKINPFRLTMIIFSPTIILVIGIMVILYKDLSNLRNDRVTGGNYSISYSNIEKFSKFSDRLIARENATNKVIESSTNLCKILRVEEETKEEKIIRNSLMQNIDQISKDVNKPTLTYDTGKFKLDGNLISPFGIRVANALENDTISQRLIENLDSMKSYGIHSVNISLQGARTGSANAFNSDGTLKSEYVNRLENILNALADRNMVGVVTYFYQARDQELDGDDAVRVAVVDATLVLKPWRNVWLYTINEWYHDGFDQPIIKTAAGQREIYNLIKGIDPQRITFVSDVFGANDGFIANTGRTASKGNVVVEYRRQDAYTSPGIFTMDERVQAQIDAEITYNTGGYWFWHAAWHQKADIEGWPRFDRGGEGSLDSPGSSFIWNTLKYLSLSDSLPFNIHLPIITSSK
jgi:hypothetical protein